jgi:hypothetical protein
VKSSRHSGSDSTGPRFFLGGTQDLLQATDFSFFRQTALIDVPLIFRILGKSNSPEALGQGLKDTQFCIVAPDFAALTCVVSPALPVCPVYGGIQSYRKEKFGLFQHIRLRK